MSSIELGLVTNGSFDKVSGFTEGGEQFVDATRAGEILAESESLPGCRQARPRGRGDKCDSCIAGSRFQKVAGIK